MNDHLRAEIVLLMRVLLRLPGFWVPTVVFPAMLYAFFGAQSGGGVWADKVMASFCIYAVVGVGFFQFGVGVAQDRENPFDTWQRSLPGRALTQWVARVIVSLFFVVISVGIVIAVAKLMNGITIDLFNWIGLIAVCLVSVIPATLMGIALGTVTSARAAVPIANLIFLPLAYLGGLWVPPIAMPQFIEQISQWTPTRAMGELSWSAVEGHAWDIGYMAVLVAWTSLAIGVIGLATAISRR